MAELKYKKILLKISGEALLGNQQFGIDPEPVHNICQEIKKAYDLGVQIAIVVGGGNIFRGMKNSSKLGMDQASGDYVGMLATVMNAIAIQSELRKIGVDCRVQSAIDIEKIAEPYIRFRAIRHLEKGRVVIFAAGTGNPFFTTDTASALRAVEVRADIILKGTRVDGIYTADPEKDPTATKFDHITYDEAYNKNLKVMDLTAFTLCKENNMPMYVFDMNTKGNLLKVLNGEEIGTLVTK